MFVCLPGNGWADVEQNINAMGNGWMLDIFGNKDLIISFAIPTIFCTSMFQGVSQMGLQTCIAAKDVKSVKKSIWLAGPVNGLFCIIPALLGIAALALGYLSKAGSAMFMTPAMLLEVLPHWVVALICASFLGALLSTFAMTSLCSFQPAVVTTINWIFTWGVPMFVMLVIGLCWKRNTKAAVITYIVSWIANVIWVTCGLMDKLEMTNFHQVYLCTIISVALGLILTAVLPGSKPGYFRLSKEEREAC